MNPYCNAVSPGYFKTMGIGLLSGRDFDIRDVRFQAADPNANVPPPYTVAIVNESYAKHYFGDRSPIGRHIGFGTNPGTNPGNPGGPGNPGNPPSNPPKVDVGMCNANTLANVGLTFTPTAVGIAGASVAIASDDPSSATVNATLVGNGVSPQISISPPSHAAPT